MWLISPGKTQIFNGSLYAEFGFGQSYPVRQGCFMASYTIGNWDLASFTRRD